MLKDFRSALNIEGAPFTILFDWCNTLGLKNEKSFQHIVLHHCCFEYIKILTNNVLSLV